jgi:hypothetical protein
VNIEAWTVEVKPETGAACPELAARHRKTALPIRDSGT